MYLSTDAQTTEDLKLFARRDSRGIYDLYDNSFTRGGRQLMELMFRKPLAERRAIVKRISIIQEFVKDGAVFPFETAGLDHLEKFINFSETQEGGVKLSLTEKEVQSGIGAAISLFHKMKSYLTEGAVSKVDELQEERKQVWALLSDPCFQPVFNERHGARISFAAITAFDVLIRIKEKAKVLQILQFVYTLDVYISVAQTAIKNNFCFPVVHERGTGILKVQGVYHPLLKDAVANDLDMTPDHNLVFLTGANMAGKSTFLRSFSTAIYIAHMGFPVAARKMEFSVMDGIYTTINLPDNLGMGASHFYAEVLRVKKMAQELSEGKSIFVLFDELFRGTNVKDALEGTLAVCKAFTNRKDSKFIISSHITEAADELGKKPGVAFYFLPTVMKGTVPEYTYRLEEGVTNDKHGMIIINNEGVLDILKNGNKGGNKKMKIHEF